ncbi:SUMF1/EgtB/PvdO family nonheme iron enzyme [Gimesia sp.]|uniref:SUMF1/EgtB/PvdO family nonheme iron enzyme n=1 Tax=Gimesia sp. TaxID=2024833 RepID=UPI003A8DEC93
MSNEYHSYGQEPSFHGQAPTTNLQPGQLADRFELVRMLGHGGMGQAWLVIDPCRKDEEREGYVVLKFLPDALRHHPDATQDFRAAYRRVQALHHESICPLFDLGESRELGCFQVMQFIPGITLRELMRSLDPERTGLELERVIRYLQPIARALDYAHQKKIIHRDIKPDNVIVDPATGEVHVIDFGLAAELRTSMSRYSQQRLSVSGTESYMPHEQWLGQPQDGRSDQYSLAVVAWELLTGQLPFQGSGMQLAYAVAQAPVPGLPEHLQHLQSVFELALSKERDHRFESVEEFVKNLSEGQKHDTRVNEQISEDKSRSSTVSQAEDLASLLLKTQDEVTRQHAEARRLLDEYHYDRAAAILEQIPSHLRDMDLFKTTVEKQDRVADLDAVISTAVKEMRLEGLHQQVKELLELQPQREDLERLLEHLPKKPVRPKEPSPLVAPFDAKTAKAGQQDWAAHLGSDVEIRNSIGMKFLLIPPGEFLMGSPESEEYRYDDEVQHKVLLTQPYYLAETVVTQGQWKSVMGTTPWKGERNVMEGDNYPAVYVSWEDAQEFIKKLNASEGDLYRLPTEAEWEFACRVGSLSAYCYGDDEDGLSDYGWFQDYSLIISEEYAHQVGEKKSNAFGLYDMHGNVWEWCEDWYGDYVSGFVTDPTGHGSGSARVFRGSCWHHVSGNCRSAHRLRGVPERRDNDLGFRVLRSSVK